MPGRSSHAKHQNTAAFCSNAERKKLAEWGTRELRLSADNFKAFDACSLCLQTAEDPLCCRKGHLFCKGCVYEYLLKVKRDNRIKLEQWDAQVRAEAAKSKAKEEEEEEAKMKAFESAASSLTRSFGSGRSTRTESSAGAGVMEGFVAKKTLLGNTVYVRDTTNSKKKDGDSAFWVPEVTPNVDPKEAKKMEKPPAQACMCPCGRKPHPLRRKKLIPVRFLRRIQPKKAVTLALKQKAKENGGSVSGLRVTNKSRADLSFYCGGCREGFTNSSKLCLMVGCGHVVCQGCTKKFCVPDRSCVSCGKGFLPGKPGLVRLEGGGSGFAKAGSTVVKSKLKPTFYC